MVVGDLFTGKTSFIKKAVGEEYGGRYIATTGLSFLSNVIPMLTIAIESNSYKYTVFVDNEAYLIKFIDTPGQNFLENCTREVIITFGLKVL